MGFIASLMHFFIVFMFTLGLTNLVTSVLAIFFFRKEIPSYKIMFIQNIISAFLISLSFLLTVNYLPHLYKYSKVNKGTLILKSKDWSEIVNIDVDDNNLRFSLCKKIYKTNNDMSSFYTKLNSALINCKLEKNRKVEVKIVSNPFQNIEELSTNSILRKYLK